MTLPAFSEFQRNGKCALPCESDLMHIDRLARTLENSQGIVHGKEKPFRLSPPSNASIPAACTRGLRAHHTENKHCARRSTTNTRSDLQLYDPEKGLLALAAAEAAHKHFARAKNLTIEAKLKEHGNFVDLDPASSKVAQKTVRAKRYFTKVEDALSREWHGRIFMNPPYYRDLLPRFGEKLFREFRDGRVSEAIVLVHSLTDSGWFHDLAGCASAIALGRIPFVSPYGEANAPVHGSAWLHEELQVLLECVRATQ